MAVNREREMLQTNVCTLDLEYETLASAREEFDRLIGVYGESAKIRRFQEAYDDTDHLGVFVDRPETDDQMVKRIALEEYYEAQQTERDLREFERLKAKLGA